VNSAFPLILVAAAFVGIVLYSRRNRQRQASADAARREQIRPGLQVMTTSGLYGTVVSMNADDTVLLSIASGVEVRWALAALRDMAELPDRYRPAPHAEAAPQSPDDRGETIR
jgi:preprotein translocase subunit YajC